MNEGETFAMPSTCIVKREVQVFITSDRAQVLATILPKMVTHRAGGRKYGQTRGWHMQVRIPLGLQYIYNKVCLLISHAMLILTSHA